MGEHFKIIEANAGTGKTFCLSTRLLSLLSLGVPANRIVSLTFTKKAAGEIRNRVFQRLANAALSNSAATELSEQLNIKIQDKVFFAKLLKELTAGNNRITISTIDSFFHQIARLFSAELSLPINWKLFDQNEYQSLVIETIVYALSNAKNLDAELSVLLQLLNEEEIDKSIVQKAYRLTSNILDSHKESTNPQLQFPSIDQIDSETISTALLALKNAPIPEGKTGPFTNWTKSIQESITLFSNKRWEEFLNKGIPKVLLQGENTYYKKDITADFRQPVLDVIEHAKNQILEAFRKKHLVTTRLVEIIWTCFQELKHTKGIVTFADIENSLASNSYNLEELYIRLDNRIDHFLIDEFQDTSATQWSILQPFFNEFISSADKSCFIVGDKKQAIYGWRGGESKLFDKVKNTYPESSVEQLNLSYRSANSIIDNVNRTFLSLEANANLSDYPVLTKKWARDFILHKTIKNTSGLVQYNLLEDEEPYFNTISDKIDSADVNAKIGILVQKNEQVEVIIQELSNLKVPIHASQEGGSYLTRSNAVKLILTAIKLLENPSDTELFFIICCSPLGKDFTNLSVESANNFSNKLFKTLQQTDFGRFVQGLVESILSEASYLDHLRLKRVVDLACVFNSSDYSLFCELVENTKFSAPSEEKVRVMTIHQSKGLEFDIVILPDLNMSLEERYSPLIRIGEDNSLIPYPNQLIRKLSPELDAAFKTNQQRKIDESLSVLYVALTRAKSELYVFLKRHRSNQVTLNNILLSEFFLEDGTELKLEN